MKIRYEVRGEKRELVPIYIRHKLGRFKSGYMIEPERWSNETETIRQRRLSETDHKLIESLGQLRSYLVSEEKLFPGVKTKEWMKGVISRFHGSGTVQTLNGYIFDFISKAESGDLKTKQGINYASGTIKSLKGLQTVLLEYQGIYSEKRLQELTDAKKTPRKRKLIDFDDITIDFYNDFIAYMSNDGFAVNTMDKHIGSLKYFLKKSLSDKKHSNREFLETSFAGFHEDSHAIYLTQDEIEKLWMHKIEDRRMEIARDCFIVLCETALRISDYKKINIGVRGKFIDIFQTKTSGRVVIPLTSRMDQILKKYNGRLPYIHEVYVNKFIKTIAFQCKITDVISWVKTEKGLKYETSSPKWKLISCHTGRRSAATNMYLAGIKTIDIMKITGHRSEKSFLKYIRITEEETARNLALHPYFNIRIV
jgi:integrase